MQKPQKHEPIGRDQGSDSRMGQGVGKFYGHLEARAEGSPEHWRWSRGIRRGVERLTCVVGTPCCGRRTRERECHRGRRLGFRS